MHKKILVFNGSPKGDKSDTIHITRAFLEGMKKSGEQDIQIVNVIDKHIEYCKGCFTCMRNGGKCIFDDDMRDILDKIRESDLLIFSYPLYAYGMPASLKVLIDRLLPLTSMEMREVDGRYRHVGHTDLSQLKYMMICGCGFPNSRKNFEPAIAQFKLLFPGENTIITVPESPMFNAPEAAAVTVPRLELVKQAGYSYAKEAVIPKELLDEICTPMIPEERYAQIVNGWGAFRENECHICAEYIKNKSWYLEYPVSDELVLNADEFIDEAVRIFMEMKPFNDYLNRALYGFAMPKRK